MDRAIELLGERISRLEELYKHAVKRGSEIGQRIARIRLTEARDFLDVLLEEEKKNRGNITHCRHGFLFEENRVSQIMEKTLGYEPHLYSFNMSDRKVCCMRKKYSNET